MPVAVPVDLVEVPAPVAVVGPDDALADEVPLVRGAADAVVEAGEGGGVDDGVVVVDLEDVGAAGEALEAADGVRGEDDLLGEALVRVVAA